MARKKVKLAWIQNDSARRATFKKRKKGLIKKVSELSTLCGVEACAIVYGPYEPTPEVWPNVEETVRILHKFRSMPEMEQSKKMMNQEGFLRQRLTKARDQLKKAERDNRETELTALMNQCMGGRGLHGLGIEDVTNLGWLLEMKLKVVSGRLEGFSQQPPPAVATGLQNAGVGHQYHHQNQNDFAPQQVQPPTAAASAAMEQGMVAAEFGHLDQGMEMMKRQEMLMYSPQFFWPAEEATLQTFIESTSAAAASNVHPYPDNNQSWLDNYFRN